MVYQTARKIIVGIIGVTVVLIGIALIVLPGPAFIVIPAGLAILGTEFLWAKRLLKKGRSAAESVLAKARGVPAKEEKSDSCSEQKSL